MKGYPLAAVEALRARDEAAARLCLRRAFAFAERCRSERDGISARAAAQRTLLREAQASTAGERALARGLDARVRWSARLREVCAALDAAARRADEEVRAAEQEASACRDAFADARRALRAVERHRERWQLARERSRERAEEAAAEDVVTARRAAT